MTRRLPPLTWYAEMRNSVAMDLDPIEHLRRRRRQDGDVFRISNQLICALDPDMINDVLTRTGRDFGQGDSATASASPVARLNSRDVLSRAFAEQHSTAVAAAFRRELETVARGPMDIVETFYEVGVKATIKLWVSANHDEIARLAAAHIRSIGSSGADRRLRHAVAAGAAHSPGPDRGAPNLMTTMHGQPADVSYDVLRRFLLSSMSSPSAVLAWSMVELAGDPDELARLRDEIDAVGYARVVADPLDRPVRLLAFIKEVLRRHTPAFLLHRTALAPTTVGPFQVDAGQTVAFSPYLMHRDARWWHEDPELFLPDRWLRSRAPHAPFAYRPFGGGPRACLARQIAMVQLVCWLATLLNDFDFAVGAHRGAALSPLGIVVPAGLRGSLAARRVPAI